MTIRLYVIRGYVNTPTHRGAVDPRACQPPLPGSQYALQRLTDHIGQCQNVLRLGVRPATRRCRVTDLPTPLKREVPPWSCRGRRTCRRAYPGWFNRQNVGLWNRMLEVRALINEDEGGGAGSAPVTGSS